MQEPMDSCGEENDIQSSSLKEYCGRLPVQAQILNSRVTESAGGTLRFYSLIRNEVEAWCYQHGGKFRVRRPGISFQPKTNSDVSWNKVNDEFQHLSGGNNYNESALYSPPEASSPESFHQQTSSCYPQTPFRQETALFDEYQENDRMRRPRFSYQHKNSSEEANAASLQCQGSRQVGGSVYPAQQENNRRYSYQLSECFCEEASAAADQYQADGGMRQPRIPNALKIPLRTFDLEPNSLSHQHPENCWTSRSLHRQMSSFEDNDEEENKRGYLLQQNKPKREHKTRFSGHSHPQANAFKYSYNLYQAQREIDGKGKNRIRRKITKTLTRNKRQNEMEPSILGMEWNNMNAILPAVPLSSTVQAYSAQGSVAIRRCGRQEVGEKKNHYLAKRKEICHETDEIKKQRVFLRVLAKRF